jgi:hypothetical protein
VGNTSLFKVDEMIKKGLEDERISPKPKKNKERG